MTIETADNLATETIAHLTAQLDIYFARKARKSTPGPCCRASEVGHQCARYLYYCVAEWQQRREPDAKLMLTFDAGHMWHDRAELWLRQVGIPLQRQNEPFQIKGRSGNPIIQGHIDGMVPMGDGAPEQQRLVPLEIKSLHPNIWDAVNTIEDFRRKPWMRKYPGQLLCYCYANSAEFGLWMLINKSTGEYKFLPLSLTEHLAEAETCLARAETVEVALAVKQPPERSVEWDTCNHCDFRHVCLPPMELDPKVIFTEDADVVTALERRNALAENRAEYDGLDDQIKTWAKATAGDADEKVIVVGDWSLTVKRDKRGACRVTAAKLIEAAKE